MIIRIPKQWLKHYSRRILREAGIDDETIEADYEAFMYEAGVRLFDEDENDHFYIAELDELEDYY
jgi:hypothetical protein